MAERLNWHARRERFLNNWHARRAARTPAATGFLSQPEPYGLGIVARGRQLNAGNLMFAGQLLDTRNQKQNLTIWARPAPDAAWAEDIHRFGWLDDLAAVGDARARHLAQDWLWDWIRRYGAGKGRVWTADATGRRMIRWIQHAVFVLRGQDGAAQTSYFTALARQAEFLSRRWRAIPPGLQRFEALTGLLYAGVSLEGLDRYVAPAHAALAEECAQRIDDTGGIVTRNPEELSEILTLLIWSRDVLASGGQSAAPRNRGGHHPYRAHLAQPAPYGWRFGAVSWRRGRGRGAAGYGFGSIGHQNPPPQRAVHGLCAAECGAQFGHH